MDSSGPTNLECSNFPVDGLCIRQNREYEGGDEEDEGDGGETTKSPGDDELEGDEIQSGDGNNSEPTISEHGHNDVDNLNATAGALNCGMTFHTFGKSEQKFVWYLIAMLLELVHIMVIN